MTIDYVDHFQRKIAYVDAVVDDVAAAFDREPEQYLRDHAQRNAQVVRDVFDGACTDAGEFGYDLLGWHVGVVAEGPTAAVVLEQMGQQLGVLSFVVTATDNMAWGWLATDRLEELPEADVHLGIGDPMTGVDGFRTTHRQAALACDVATRLHVLVCRYDDVTIEAAALRDETAARMFVERELGELANLGERNNRLRATLEAYLVAGHNEAAVGHQLQVQERTVAHRLRLCEDILGRPVLSRAAELETALRWGRTLRMFA
jgi:diguanylate cyclase with GGDEF domain/PucR-like helix-turn-helix protein